VSATSRATTAATATTDATGATASAEVAEVAAAASTASTISTGRASGTAAARHSALYSGWVRHRRFLPRPRAFTYRVFMLYLDLAELPAALSGRLFWSAERPALVRFRRADYLGPVDVPLDTAVRDRVQAATGRRPDGPIRLLTNLACLGYCFNPVSFYYCFDATGTTPTAVVAEITNTPWSERHVYVLDAARDAERPSGARPAVTAAAEPAAQHDAAQRDTAQRDARRTLRFRFAKRFHVSPFLPLDMDYDWRFGAPGEHLLVHMDVARGGSVVLDATLQLERRPLDGGQLARALLRHPFMSGKVHLAIYWQALLLRLRRTPFFPHTASRPGQEPASR